MSLMSSRALSTLRRNAERWMVDTIEIWSPPTWEDSDDDLESEHSAGVKVWEGKARIRPTSGPSQQAIGDTVFVTRDADINIPLDAPDPRADMRVKVVTSADPALQDRWFRITDVRAFGQQAMRKFSVVQTQEDRDWREYVDPDPPTNVRIEWWSSNPLGSATKTLLWDASASDDVVRYDIYTVTLSMADNTYTKVGDVEADADDLAFTVIAYPSSTNFVVTALDEWGNESSYSTMVTS